MKHLLDAGLLHGDSLTVTGKTMAENLEAIDPPAPDGDVVHPLDAPIHALGGIAVLQGSLAPKGAVVKVAGIDVQPLRGDGASSTARTGRWTPSSAAAIQPGDIVVIRYEGPKGGPGMREMLAVTGAMKGAGRGGDARAGHRRPVLGRHPRLLRRPRRSRGGRRRSDRPRARRRPHRHRRRRPHRRPAWSTTPSWPAAGPSWKLPEPRYTSGVLAKYARLAQATGAEIGVEEPPPGDV